jgi:hypothetical protein
MNNTVKSVDISNPDPFASMLFFFIVTAVYCVINIFMGIGSTMKQIIMKACYILFIIIGEYFINLNLSYSMCGIYQWQSVLTITIIPWLLIFGVLHLFLSMFPGWLSPFSNTFGYLVVKLMGLPQLLKDDILNNGINTPGNDETVKALINVNSDQSLLINQMYPDKTKYDTIWEKLEKSKIFKNYTIPDDKVKYKNKLYYYVEMKNTISEFIWNLLTGFLVTSVTYNYIVNIGCKKSVQDMKKRHDAYEASQTITDANKAAAKANIPNYRQTS